MNNELKTRDELIEKLESNNRQEQEKPVLDENIRREIRREVASQSCDDLSLFIALSSLFKEV